MFVNRLRKNLRHLGKWARRAGVTCYRIYDADLPEYAVAIDLYQVTGKVDTPQAAQEGPDARRNAEGGVPTGGGSRRTPGTPQRGAEHSGHPSAGGVTAGGPSSAAGYEGWAHVQEYAPPPTVDSERAATRLRELMAATPALLGIPPERVILKVRRRQKGPTQYERQAATGRFHEIREGGLRFLVNLTDYLDTGLFLDHRPTRALVRELAAGARFLNLFAYTGSATVYAAAGGALTTTTVDMSGAYLDWARRNLAENGFPEGARHRFVRGDCLAWLAAGRRERFDLIFLDPPTFSNSKRMGERTFEVQGDHAPLIAAAARLLAPGGRLLFSNNFRQFRMDRAALPELLIEEITLRTIPPDFQRNPRIHNCWMIQRKPA